MSDKNKFTVVTTEDLMGYNFTSSNFLFKSASDFSQYIEMTAAKESRTCTQVIIEYCEDRDIWPADVAKLIIPSLKGKIQMEMIEAGLMDGHATLECLILSLE
jgi:hypothetical protein